MSFYRVQKENGCGVYRGNGCLGDPEPVGGDLFEELYSCDKHPTPMNDSELVRSMKKAGANLIKSEWFNDFLMDHKFIKPYIFGFSSLEQFNSWFYNDEIKKGLKEMDYKLYHVKRAKSVLKGNSQSIILKEEFAEAEKEMLELI